MKRTLILVAATTLTALYGFGQDPMQQAPQGEGSDVPGRAARLGMVQGTVSFQPASVDDWVPAEPNRPVTTGDKLWTEAGARAELHLGSAAFRLNGRTNFSFINLDDRTAQVQLSVGTLGVRVRRLAEDEVIEIDTPQAALSILRPGEYRIDVNEQGDTTIATVRGGEMEATAGQAFTIHPRDQVRIVGTEGQPATFDRRDAPVADSFDLYCEDRDRREDRSESSRYVSRDMPGYADLDGAGRWQQSPEYGAVWYPQAVPAGWAPYRYGHWAWIAPWGWTWVDDAPWGYAPFHYGRWVFVGSGWAWVPGPVVPRPVYAPAMVAWVGGGSFSVGVAVGGGPAVGWFPLGPREVWVPAYRYSPAYLERVNITNTVIVNRTVIQTVNVANVTYVNRGVAGAVTVVPQSAMTSGRPVAIAAVQVRPEIVARAEVRTLAVVAPERTAVLGARVQASAAPPAAFVNRTVVARATPPPPPPPFVRQQQILRQNPGQPAPRSAVAQLQESGSAASRPTIRQVGPPPAASGSAPAPIRGSVPATPPQSNPQPEFRGQSSSPALPAPPQGTPQPQLRRQPIAPAQTQQPAPAARPAAPQTQTLPEFRRNAPQSLPSRPNQKQSEREAKGKRENKRREEDKR